MHNTGNPIGSDSLLDLYDNSSNIDQYVNSQEDTFPDRFGVKRLTLAGLIKRSMALRNEINDFSGALTFKPEWSDVPMNVSEGVGGEGGALNLQAEALGNRSEINKITSREALRRTYLEAGYNLVEGSFEQGATITASTDVVLYEANGKCYSGPIGTIPAKTNPLAGSYVDRVISNKTVYLSKYQTLAEAINKNLLVKDLKIIADKDTVEVSPATYTGDLEITGRGTITLPIGMTSFINHSCGSVRITKGIKFKSLDTTTTNSIFALNSVSFDEIDVSATIERVGIKARNNIANVFGTFKFNGIIIGDFTSITTPVNDGIIFVEGAQEVNVDGMTNFSIGAERIIKCSHSVETFCMRHAKFRGSTKRQVVDTYIDTRKVICQNNDVDMSSFEVFIEGKLKTESDLPGISPAQVSVDISKNVFKIGLDLCNRVALFQAPGGTSLSPAVYGSIFSAENNVIIGRTSSTTFDVRGFTAFKEHGTVYHNVNLSVRPAVSIIACDKIDIAGIIADSYSVNIAGSGSSQGGLNYARSPMDISVKGITAKYSNTGFVYVNDCNSINKLSVTECKLTEDTSSPASTGLIFITASTIGSINCLNNEAIFNTSIPIRAYGTVNIGKQNVLGNNWQRDLIPFTSQVLAHGASVRFQFPNINGNYTGSTERFTVTHSEDLKGCTICGYKEGNILYAEIYNYTGASVTIDAGTIYLEIAKL